MMQLMNGVGKELEGSSSSHPDSPSTAVTTTAAEDGSSNSSSSSSGWIPITIQHQNDRFALSVSKYQTISDLKQSVIQKVVKHKNTTTPATESQQQQHHPSSATSSSSLNNNYYVRLIAAGRLLAPDDAKLEDWNIQQDQILHAVIVEGINHHHHHHHTRNNNNHHHHNRNQQQRTRNADDESQSSSYNDEDDDDIYEDDSEEEEEEDDDDMPMDDTEQDIERGTGGRQRRRHTNTTSTSNTSALLLRNRIPLGFDRLRITAGLRRADVLAIRISFNPQIDRWLEMHPEFAYLHEADVLRRRRLQEEAWMVSQGPASEFTLNLGGRIHNNNNNTTTNTTTTTTTMNQRWAAQSAGGATTTTTTTTTTPWRTNNIAMMNPNTANLHQLHSSLSSTTVGTDRDFIWGFLLGFFVGFLMLLWVWMPTVPHKQKLGILAGYSFHLGLGMLQNKHFQQHFGEEDEYASSHDAFHGEDATTILGGGV